MLTAWNALLPRIQGSRGVVLRPTKMARLVRDTHLFTGYISTSSWLHYESSTPRFLTVLFFKIGRKELCPDYYKSATSKLYITLLEKGPDTAPFKIWQNIRPQLEIYFR